MVRLSQRLHPSSRSTPKQRIIRWMNSHASRPDLVKSFSVTEFADRDNDPVLKISLVPVAAALQDEQKKKDLFRYVRELRRQVAPVEQDYLKYVNLDAPVQ